MPVSAGLFWRFTILLEKFSTRVQLVGAIHAQFDFARFVIRGSVRARMTAPPAILEIFVVPRVNENNFNAGR